LQTSYGKKVKNWDLLANNFFEFMMENFPTELVVMGAKTAIANYKIPFDSSKLPSFDKFYNQYGKIVISAMAD
jgi:hypothetical protein